LPSKTHYLRKIEGQKREEKEDVQEKRGCKECTSSHGSKKFRTKSMQKQGGMAFDFQKTATAVIKPDR
jgi:hypothetical protein